MKKITEKPGRYFAIFIFAPVLLYCGLTVRKNHINVSNTLIFFQYYYLYMKCFGFVIKII